MTAVDLDELAARHARAQAEAEAAATELAEREQQMLTEQTTRRAEWDTDFVDGYRARVQEIEARSRSVREAFRLAVLDSPVIAAWIDLRADRWRRMVLAGQVQGSLVRLGREQEAARHQGPEWRDPRLFEDVLEFAEIEAQSRAEDEGTELDRLREEHATGVTT